MYFIVTDVQATEDSHYYDGWIDDISAETTDPCIYYTDYDRLNRNEQITNNDCMGTEEPHITGSMWIRISGDAGNAMATTVRFNYKMYSNVLFSDIADHA